MRLLAILVIVFNIGGEVLGEEDFPPSLHIEMMLWFLAHVETIAIAIVMVTNTCPVYQLPSQVPLIKVLSGKIMQLLAILVIIMNIERREVLGEEQEEEDFSSSLYLYQSLPGRAGLHVYTSHWNDVES